MSDFIEVKGKTEDEAILNAILELQTTSDHLDYEVIDRGSTGFLGIGSKPVVIKARKMTDEEYKATASSGRKEVQSKDSKSEDIQNKSVNSSNEIKPTEVKKPEIKKPEVKKPEVKKPEAKKPEEKPIEQEKSDSESKNSPEKEIHPVDVTPMLGKVKEFLENVFKAMDMAVEISVKASEEINTIEVELKGDNMGVLIGKRGQTLDSLQYLSSIIVNSEQEEYIRIKLDTENYRIRRKDTLENLAKNIASKVRRTNKEVALEPMNPYERRIIHSALQKDKYVDTHSVGEEPYRKVVVTPNKNCGQYAGGGHHKQYGGKPYNKNRRGGQTRRPDRPDRPSRQEHSDRA